MKVLIVEDSAETQAFLSKVLKSLGAEIQIASTLGEAKAALDSSKPDLILLDMTLPDGTGFEFCESMIARENQKPIPFLFISGNEDISTKVAAFSLGAEDYIVKPFNMMELKARLDAKIKKISAQNTDRILIERGALSIDISKQQVRAKEDTGTRLISFTPREFQILAHIAQREDHVISRNQLIDSVWGSGSEVFDRTVDTHVSAIRKKLGNLSHYIESIPGSGYRFSASATAQKKAG